MYERARIVLNKSAQLDPKTAYNLTIGVGGIQLYGSKPVYISGGENSVLTSSQSFLDIRLNVEGEARDHLFINAVIADNGRQKVGLRVSGTHKNWAAVVLNGKTSNTFTGDVEVSGGGNVLSLAKENGAKAILGNILIKDNGKIALWRNDQIADTSTVTMRNGVLQFTGSNREKREAFHRLVIEGHSRLQYGFDNVKDKRLLYLDELVISDRSLLEVQDWKEGRDFLLVKKTSKNLNNALKKIRFQGYDPKNVHLEDYNKDYWSISGAPESTTYGAIFSTGALGFVFWRRKRKLAVG